MAEKNVGSFIVTVKAEVDKEDLKRVEHEYTEKFKQIGEKCADIMNERIGFNLLKGGIWTTILTAAMAGISAVLDTGFEKASGELDELLQKANEVSATASQFGANASPYEMLVAKSVAAQAGIGPNDLQNMMLKFSIMQANNDPLLKNFHSGDSMQDFFSFINALHTLNPNQSLQAAVKVFGRLDAGKAQILANSDVNAKIEETHKGLADKGITQNTYDNSVKDANNKYAEQQAGKLQNEAYEIIKGDKVLNTSDKNETYKGQTLVQIQDKHELIEIDSKIDDLKSMITRGDLQNDQDKIRQQMQEILKQVQNETLPKIKDAMQVISEVFGDKKGPVHGFTTVTNKKADNLKKTEDKMYKDAGLPKWMEYLP